VVIVDTTVWVDYFRGQENPETEWLNNELGRQPFGLTDLILCEVLQGVQPESAYAEVQRELRKFDLFETGGEKLAIAAAENYRKMQQRGRTVRKTIDCLIATFCLMHGHSLLHRDHDFNHFEQLLKLSVIHP
jgi:predicted nucleic acid-binding protein